jgi:hypothetical protein
MMMIHGKKAIRVCHLVPCDNIYWIDEDGRIFVGDMEYGFSQEYPFEVSNGGSSVLLVMNGRYANHFPEKLAAMSKDKKLQTLWESESTNVFPVPVPPKKWVIGDIDDNGRITLYHRNPAPYADEALLEKDMELILKNYPKAVLVKLELTDVLQKKVQETKVWSKA